MSFRFMPLAIPDVVLIEPRAHLDERGLFLESYRRSAFRDGGVAAEFVQDNRSLSRRGVLRGLHYQRPPHAQGKLVSVVAGEVFDVAVDLRSNSPTFGHWVGESLSAANRLMLWIPEGFAHGFQATSDEAQVHYKTTSEYAPQADAGLHWNDPQLAIAWPLLPPILSPKDAGLPELALVGDDFNALGSR